jgi:Eukaryotic mitochondrial regulator protein
MLPKTRLNSAAGRTHHEPINDLPILSATKSQLFYPVSESRSFTREDAGHAFLSRTPKQRELLPADKRIPHPEMIVLEKAEGLGFLEKERLKEELEKDEKERLERAKEMKREREKRGVTVVSKRRADFRFTDVSVDQVGRDGRNRRGVGWRYGMPHEDRKPGQIKIPTSV